MPEKGTRINNVEWGIFIFVLLLIDIGQVVIEWLLIWIGISIAINIIIDAGIAFLIPLYLRLRGQKVGKPSQMFGLLGTLLLEMIPVIDELPLWCLDGVFYMIMAKREYKKEDKQIQEYVNQQNQAKAEEEARMAEEEAQNEALAQNMQAPEAGQKSNVVPFKPKQKNQSPQRSNSGERLVA